MLSPPRLRALQAAFHAVACRPLNRAITGAAQGFKGDILHADPCTLGMHTPF